MFNPDITNEEQIKDVLRYLRDTRDAFLEARHNLQRVQELTDSIDTNPKYKEIISLLQERVENCPEVTSNLLEVTQEMLGVEELDA